MMPTAYFQFDGALPAALAQAQLIPADPAQPLWLIDIDPQSVELGKLFPLVVNELPTDLYTPAHLVALSTPPGIVLRGRHSYAFVVRRELGDSTGALLGVPPQLWALENGQSPGGPYAAQAQAEYVPLWKALLAKSVDPTDVAVANVFTTGDVVMDLAALSSAVIARDPVVLTQVALAPDGGRYDGFCELSGAVTFPKYQQGTPPFTTSGGTFALGADGLPAPQGSYANVPVEFTFPKGRMPDAGYPLVMYFHGSGGVSRQAIDRGTAVLDAGVWTNTPGQGPAWVLAPFGLATVCAALPLNPERLPGASDTAYLNLTNLAAFPDTFRQGVIEERALMAALQTLTIPFSAADQATCGITLPAGESALHYDASNLFAQGQSMGGMYTNLISAVEPRILAAVPTGAGGGWQSFVLTSPQVPTTFLPLVLFTGSSATWQHPLFALLETAWEPAEPMVYAARLGRRPLPNHPVRPVYEPVGPNDSYFAQATYDGMATAYGNEQAGTQVWTSMQASLALEGRAGLVPYPVSDNVPSEAGPLYTGVVAQYVDPTGYDGHDIFTQVEAVKHQYGCFFGTRLITGTSTVVAPGTLGSPCQ